MSEVLSQNEIDALLSVLNSGSVNVEELKKEHSKKKVKVYDFRRPSKFSKDQLHTLHVIHDNYARALSTFLSGQLRMPVQMEVLSVEQLTYEEFMISIPNPTILNICSCYPLEGNMILEINPNLGFAILDRLLGGQGQGQAPVKTRSLTEIEETVMERIVKRMLGYLAKPWENIIEIEPSLDRVENNPQFMQLVSPNEVMMIVSIETRMGDVQGMMNICMPFLVLEPIMDKLSVRLYYSSSAEKYSPENMSLIQNKLATTRLPIKAILGGSRITVKDLLELSVGDVIPLEKRVGAEMDLVIGDNTKFMGKPGMYEGKLAIQICHVVEEVMDDE